MKKVIAAIGLLLVMTSANGMRPAPRENYTETGDIVNGLTGLNRDAIIHLVKVIPNPKTRLECIELILGMCQQHYKWGKHPRFKRSCEQAFSDSKFLTLKLALTGLIIRCGADPCNKGMLDGIKRLSPVNPLQQGYDIFKANVNRTSKSIWHYRFEPDAFCADLPENAFGIYCYLLFGLDELVDGKLGILKFYANTLSDNETAQFIDAIYTERTCTRSGIPLLAVETIIARRRNPVPFLVSEMLCKTILLAPYLNSDGTAASRILSLRSQKETEYLVNAINTSKNPRLENRSPLSAVTLLYPLSTVYDNLLTDEEKEYFLSGVYSGSGTAISTHLDLARKLPVGAKRASILRILEDSGARSALDVIKISKAGKKTAAELKSERLKLEQDQKDEMEYERCLNSDGWLRVTLQENIERRMNALWMERKGPDMKKFLKKVTEDIKLKGTKEVKTWFVGLVGANSKELGLTIDPDWTFVITDEAQ